MKDRFFYEIQDRRTGATEANYIYCDSLQHAETAIYGAAIKTKVNVLQVWNMDVWDKVQLSPLVYDNPKSH